MITSKKAFGSYVVEKVEEQSLASASATGPSEDTEAPCAIPDTWTEVELVNTRPYNHDTSIFRFCLPNRKSRLNLPVGGFLLVRAPGCEHDGGDAVRPYTSIQEDDMNPLDGEPGTFEILCKRYDQWGIKESVQTHFLFTKTNHSYRPPGAVSNFIHRLEVGDRVQVKHTPMCRGKIPFPFPGVKALTLIAVGVGVAPMVQILRGIFKSRDYYYQGAGQLATAERSSECAGRGQESLVDDSTADSVRTGNSGGTGARPPEVRLPPKRCGVERIVLLYGVRTVADILMREQLEKWQARYGEEVFKVVFCVGSRWSNVHWGVKTRGKGEKEQYVPPPVPAGFDALRHAEQGWVNEEVVRKHGFPPGVDSRVLVCGLPGVYDKLCGGRDRAEVAPHSVLHRLGYTQEHVIKL